MNNIQKRFLLFIFGCISIRLLFVYIAKTIDNSYLPILGLLALIPAIGFFYIFFTNSRETGPEVFGEKIWWNNLRILHGLLYLIFAILAITRQSYAWIALLIDVSIGLLSFLYFHYSNGNFNKL